MIDVKDLCVNYGAIEAVRGISFEVPDGAIVTLIGANGAGKSTTLRAIAGLEKPAGGSIRSRPRLLYAMMTHAGQSTLLKNCGKYALCACFISSKHFCAFSQSPTSG